MDADHDARGCAVLQLLIELGTADLAGPKAGDADRPTILVGVGRLSQHERRKRLPVTVAHSVSIACAGHGGAGPYPAEGPESVTVAPCELVGCMRVPHLIVAG